MTGMNWYKVRIMVPGTDGDVESGMRGPVWRDDMEQAPNEETALRQADEKARRRWEEPNYYEPGVEAPSDRELGQECPVCTGASAVTDEEYAEWKREREESAGELPFE